MDFLEKGNASYIYYCFLEELISRWYGLPGFPKGLLEEFLTEVQLPWD